jgi:hypothetical protein
MSNISKKLLEVATTESCPYTKAVFEAVAREIKGTVHDEPDPLPAGPNPYQSIADEHGVEVEAFSTWARKQDLAPEAIALVDVAEFRRVTS